MNLPQFYHTNLLPAGHEIWLDEDTVRHVVQVLRMQAEHGLTLSNGVGDVAWCTIKTAEKKKCLVVVNDLKHFIKPTVALHLAMAFTKNSSRNEWLLEKATELGVSSIIPLLCTRSLKEKIRIDRWHNILVSAMLQSQQYSLPRLHEPITLQQVLANFKEVPQKLMAHCMDDNPRHKISEMLKPGSDAIILIGPEGDFTVDEVNLCVQHQYTGIQLGKQRLRTETAALEVCSWFNILNYA